MIIFITFLCTMGQASSKASSIRKVYTNKIIYIDENKSEFETQQLSAHFIVTKLQTIDESIRYIRESFIIDDIAVICTGSLLENFLNTLKKNPDEGSKVKQIYVFCWEKEKYQSYLGREKIICVDSNTDLLINNIHTNISALLIPNFRNLTCNEAQRIQIKYSYFLAFLTSPIAQEEREVKIYKCVETFNRLENKSFEVEKYPASQNHRQILHLYSGSDFYLFINKMLKANTLQNLENAHIIIHDLFQAIREFSTYAMRGDIPSVLFRGAQLSDGQIKELEQNIGQQIQSLGFFSTSKDINVVTNSYFVKNTVFKVYIPQFFKKYDSNNIKVRGGYIELQKIIEPEFKNEKEVLFNIKSIFTVLRVYKTTALGRQLSIVELLYGKDQLLCFLNQNKANYTVMVHNQSAKELQKECPDCHSTFHLYGTASKQKICLNNLKNSALNKESFILINKKNRVSGIELSYDELAMKEFLEPHIEKPSICYECKSKVKCSGCFGYFCLCTLKKHDERHLRSQHILIEGELPHFVMLELNQDKLTLLENHFQIEKSITNMGDALIQMKDPTSYAEAQKQYSYMINQSNFSKLSQVEQYKIYFNRAESYRYRKYIPQKRQKMTVQKLEACIKDYQQCFDLVRNLKEEVRRRAMAKLHIGIVEDDIANIVQEEVVQKNKDKGKSEEEIKLIIEDLFKTAMKNYDEALQILASSKATTKKERLLAISIKNCQGFVYWHQQKHELAIAKFEDILSELQKLQRPQRVYEAKYLNNVVCCTNDLVQRLNWSDLANISSLLKQNIARGERSYNLRLCLFGEAYCLTKGSFFSWKKAQYLLFECQQRLN